MSNHVIEPKDIHTHGQIALPNGWTATVRIEHDDDMQEPWKEHDGHGSVRKVHYSEYNKVPKLPSERVLHRDRGTAWLYDFAGAVETARKDGWSTGNGTHCAVCKAELTESLTEHPWQHRTHRAIAMTPRAEAALAAEADYDYLRRWLTGDWEWIGVIVQVLDAAGEEVGEESLWGVESLGDFWKDVAAELIDGIAAGVVAPNEASA